MTDANVWIDLRIGGLLEAVLRLPVVWVSPDVVLAELQDEDPSDDELRALGVLAVSLTGEQVAEVGRLAALHPGTSGADLAALVLARPFDHVLLTGDRLLRRAAAQEGVTVHGTIWLMDELVRQRIVTVSRATEALEQMEKRGRRLPAGAIQNWRAKWRGEAQH